MEREKIKLADSVYWDMKERIRGHDFGPMLFTAVVQLVWSLPMAAALYFPCRAIARKKI